MRVLDVDSGKRWSRTASGPAGLLQLRLRLRLLLLFLRRLLVHQADACPHRRTRAVAASLSGGCWDARRRILHPLP